MIEKEKQEAIDIMNKFIDWFNYHKLPIDDALFERVVNFINS